MTVVLGVDGCRGGWCSVAIEVLGERNAVRGLRVHESFAEVMAKHADVICVDIPIGLLDRSGQRECDTEARRILERKRGSVFSPPSRAALIAADYSEACDINQSLTGKRLTQQSFNIRSKIREVDERMDSVTQEQVLEVHPELCFWALNGSLPVMSKKKRVAGRIERWEILRRHLSELAPSPPMRPELPIGCGPDDHIDAMVCAWTAACVIRGTARRVPESAEVDDRGLRMEMWLPG